MSKHNFYRLLDALEVAGVPTTAHTLQTIVRLAESEHDLASIVASWIECAQGNARSKGK